MVIYTWGVKKPSTRQEPHKHWVFLRFDPSESRQEGVRKAVSWAIWVKIQSMKIELGTLENRPSEINASSGTRKVGYGGRCLCRGG